jgi:serine/threonine-protein kinase
VLGLQNNFIDREALLDAFNRWALDRSRPLGQVLLERGALSPGRLAVLEALVEEHLGLFDHDPEKSLAALEPAASVREVLSRIADLDLTTSLARIPAARADDDPDRTASYAGAGDSTSAGARFRILRPHARGGLGEVFIALDTELNRDVALKEIQPQFADDPSFRTRFEFEAEVTGGLEHPGVVPVYGLGHTPDGRPFYAMRFVRGDSLKEAVRRFHDAEAEPGRDPGRSALELRELLGRFMDVCDAMAYAHSRGVLHRDLKPGNIMLGHYGETLVVDWGLAKVLDRSEPPGPADPPEPPLRPSSGSHLEPTQAGSAIGTPGYMSPEQAAGRLDRLGPRSDVYCLGATLYYLLTGRVPCEAEDIGEVLRKIQAGDVRRPRSLNPRVAPTLEAVCLKAMALDPDDRYESAAGLKSDLERWLADEPVTAYREPAPARARRWMRRHRTLVTSTAAVLVFGLAGLAGFATVLSGKNRQLDDRNRQLAGVNRQLDARNLELAGTNRELDARNLELDRQRQRAERREAMAIDAVRKFRGAVEANVELKNRPDLDPLRKTLLKEPLAFFSGLRDELQADRDTRPEAVANLADANYDLARTTEEIGSYPDAIRSYSESIGLHERLARDRPASASCQYHLAASHNHRGALYRATGRPKEAMESYRLSAALFERLARDHPSVIQHQDDQAGCYLNMGNLLRAMGQPAEAIASYRKGLEIFERLARDHPADGQVQLDLAVSHMNIGNVLGDAGRRAEALDAYRRALPIQERLARDHPGVHKFENSLAGCLDNIGLALAALGRPNDAMAPHRRALEIFQRLARDHPSVTDFQDDLAMCHMNLGCLNLSLGRPDEALIFFRGGLEAHERLVRDHPSVPNFRSGLGGALNNVAMVEMNQGRWPEARARLERAVEQQRAALAALPGHPVYRRFLRNHLFLLTQVHRALNQPAEAARAAREWAGLVRGNPADLYNVACSLASCATLAQGEARQDLAAEAVAMLRRAIAAGWNDARRTGRDPDLDPLRDRDDFRRLLAELLDRGFPAQPFAP